MIINVNTLKDSGNPGVFFVFFTDGGTKLTGYGTFIEILFSV